MLKLNLKKELAAAPSRLIQLVLTCAFLAYVLLTVSPASVGIVNFSYMLFMVLAAVTSLINIARSPTQRWSWFLFSGFAFLILGDSLVVGAGQTVLDPLPAIFYLVSYVLFAVAVSSLSRQQVTGFYLRLAVSAIAAVSAAYLWWVGTTLLDSTVNMSWWALTPAAGSLLLASVAFGSVLIIGPAADLRWLLILLGSAVLWLADSVIFIHNLSSSVVSPSNSLKLAWAAGIFLMAASSTFASPDKKVVLVKSYSQYAIYFATTVPAIGLLILAVYTDVPPFSVFAAAFAVLLSGWFSTISAHKLTLAQSLVVAATTDELTGLFNRRALVSSLDELKVDKYAVLVLDLDGFKEVNDGLGHAVGDAVLVELSARIKRASPVSSLCARHGGDEFVVVLPDYETDEASRVAARIGEAISEPIEVSGLSMKVTASIGVASFPEAGDALPEVLLSADRAMYRAKRSLIDVAVYSEDPSGAIPNLVTVSDIRQAMAEGQIVCYYQPQLDLHTDTITGVEALVRWQHPTRGVLGPEEFLDAVTASSIVKDFSYTVLHAAISDLGYWRSKGCDIQVSVNLSVANLLDMQLCDTILSYLDTYDVPASKLTVEITESAVSSDPTRMRAAAFLLRSSGIHVSVDDYGTGYSSLSQIADLSADEMKLDKRFVSGLSANDKLRSVVQSSIHLASGLGLTLVAEGVQTLSELNFLRASGADVVQGYLIAPPMPAEEFIRWFSRFSLPTD